MTWLKVDDSFWSHPKTMMLSSDAIALWVRAGSWSCQHLTDGLISDRSLPIFASTPEAVAELVDVGFWNVVDGGYEFHDWDDYQEKSETVKERRAKARERMRVVRANSERTKHERAMEQNAKFAESSLNPDPTRPDPTRPSSSSNEEEEKPPRKRGTRIPEPFFVTPEMRDWATERTPLVNVDTATEKFVNHWRAKTTGATKLDWRATWNNWLISDQERAESRAPSTQPRPTAAQKNMPTVDYFRRLEEEEQRMKEIEG